jgi:hypothetical protein
MVASLRISPELLNQLKRDAGLGEAIESSKAGTPAQREYLPSFSKADAQTRSAIEKSKELQSALITSESVGGLLLKQEDSEISKIEAKAAELLSSEFAAPPRQPPCAEERSSVLSCYQLNPGNELKCAQLVSAYERCADIAFRAGRTSS